MPFTDRYFGYPSDAELTSIEGMKIVEIAGPTAIAGQGTGVVCIVGEFLKGKPNVPAEVFSPADIASQFGLWSNYSNPGGTAFPAGMVPGCYDGNGYMALSNKRFARLVLVNVDQSVGTCTVTVADPTDRPEFVIPAGARMQDATGGTGAGNVFALLDDIAVVAGDYSGTGGTATPYTATYTGRRMRRVFGSATGPTADSFVPGDAAAIAPTGVTLDCTLFSTVTTWDATAADGAYYNALQTLLNDAKPSNQVDIPIVARHDATINTYLRQLVDAMALKRPYAAFACISPPVGTAKGTFEASGAGAVGDTNVSRDQFVAYCAPGVQRLFPFIPQGKNSATQAALQDWTMDSSVAAVLSNLPEEMNPGVLNAYMSDVVGIESAVTGLTEADYKAFKRLGICAPIIDPVNGAMIQSGCTSVDPSAYPTLQDISERRMKNMIEGDLSTGLAGFSKALSTPTNRRASACVIRTYLDGLLSRTNPAKQRILEYIVDEVSGNTPAQLAAGIDITIIKVKTIPSRKFIVFQVSIGQTVDVTAIG